MDFEVIGVDSSSVMIDTARRAYGAQIEFQVADADSISRFEEFDIITSIMVFQFVHGIANLVCQLASILRPGGLLVFAVFNPAYVVERIAAKRAFHDFTQQQRRPSGTSTSAAIDGFRPSFRSASEYDRIEPGCGLTQLLEDYPNVHGSIPGAVPTVHTD